MHQSNSSGGGSHKSTRSSVRSNNSSDISITGTSSSSSNSSTPVDTNRSSRKQRTPRRPPPHVPSIPSRITSSDDWYNRAPTSSDPISDLMARMESLSADRVSPVRLANDPFRGESKIVPSNATQTPEFVGVSRSDRMAREQLTNSRSIFSPRDPFDYHQ